VVGELEGAGRVSRFDFLRGAAVQPREFFGSESAQKSFAEAVVDEGVPEILPSPHHMSLLGLQYSCGGLGPGLPGEERGEGQIKLPAQDRAGCE
jgi:hypothetical protein